MYFDKASLTYIETMRTTSDKTDFASCICIASVKSFLLTASSKWAASLERNLKRKLMSLSHCQELG